MIIQNKILNLLLFLTLLFGATPTEYVLSISTGYDNNVMRFSEKDFTEALVNPKILGNATTYDSYILKFSLRGKKTIYKNKNNEIIFKGNFSTSDYRNNKNKKYLGIYKFMRLRKLTKANLVALGGIKTNDFNLIKKINVNKIASISLFKK